MDDWDEDDMACMDATVLFAVPGKPVQLMTEEEALSKFPGFFDDEQKFYCVEIGDHLFLHYLVDGFRWANPSLMAWSSMLEIQSLSKGFLHPA